MLEFIGGVLSFTIIIILSALFFRAFPNVILAIVKSILEFFAIKNQRNKKK